MLSQKEFVDRVIRPLLGKEYVLELVRRDSWLISILRLTVILCKQPIATSESFLGRLAANVQSARPSSRLKTEIITDAPVSFIMADLTQIWPGEPTLTFELKVHFKCTQPPLYANRDM